MGIDEILGESIPRRKFLKRTIMGGAVLAGAPIISSLFSGEEAYAQEEPLSGVFGREELARILREALSQGGDFADVYVERILTTTIAFSEGRVESVKYGLDQGAGVRVLRDDQTGYAYCQDLKLPSVIKAARAAAIIASGPRKEKIARLSVRTSGNCVPFSLNFLDVKERDKVAVLEKADAAARAVDSRIAQVKLTYEESIDDFILANSEGVFASDELPMVWITVDAIAADGDKKRPGYVRLSGRSGFEFFNRNSPEDAGRKAAKQAITMLNSRPAPMGEMPVVLASGGGVLFHEAVGHGLEADSVKRQTSMFAGKVGQVVGSDKVTVVDDATIPNLRGSFNFDSEGTPAQKKVLIDKGVLAGYMNDLITAKYLNVPPTGNGRRETYRNFPLVRMTNTYLAPGALESREIIEATQKGIYAKDLGGGEVDTASGDFTFGVREAYLIENGKIGAPVLGATLIGSGPEIMKRIDMVGNDISYWPGTCGKGQYAPVTSGAPTLRISRITVGGRE
ncbi:MAG: TldD/PmbA family protein [Candidatus Eisenbacteria bacterium]|nr:TldD/PmbA family protein [Candidatus Eisenbacteria bacterium]